MRSGRSKDFGTTPPALAAVAWIATVWLLALAYDADGEVNGFTRGVAFVPIAFAAVISPEAALAPAALLFVLSAGEGVVRKQRELTIAAVAPLLWLQFVGAALSGLSVGAAGLALTVAACVWFGFATLVHGSHRLPLEIAGVATAVAGVLAAAATPETLGAALLVLGVTGVATGLARSSLLVAHIGGAVATLGLWVTLDAHDVVFAELYAAPVALQLLAAGYAARHNAERHVGSWIAYAPGIALIAWAALAERFAGEGPVHSLIAGIVGVIAVVAGGRFRLSAPLVLGTATLVVVVARETFDVRGPHPALGLARGGRHHPDRRGSCDGAQRRRSHRSRQARCRRHGDPLRISHRRTSVRGWAGAARVGRRELRVGQDDRRRAARARLGVSHIELDAIRHQPSWQELPDDEFRSRVAVLIDADGWVVDGNYGAVRDLVWSRADTVVWLDLPASRRRPADRDAFRRPCDGAA